MADFSTSAGSGRRRVLVLGLDAADAHLLLAGTEDGTLPNLARLRSEGAWGVVTSPAGFGSGAVWPSVATGVSPAKHARYYYRQVGPGSYEAHRFEADEFRAAPVWESISDSGRRIAVFDVPKVGLSDGINGRIAVDWMSHGPVYTGLRTWPDSYAAQLTSTYGADPLPKCDMPGGRDEEQMRDFLAVLDSRIIQRERCTRDEWADDDLDLLVTVFAEPHCVGHQAWHVRDPEHPQFDRSANTALGDPVVSVYASIDASIGRLVDDVDDDTVVIVFSGTGMGPNYTGNYILDEVLRRLEGTTITKRLSLTNRAKLIAKRLLPRELRRRGRPLKRKVEESAAVNDRARRRSFVVPHNDIAGAIRLNVVGREPEGLLRPDQIDAYVDELSEQLLALRNADTGEPAVDRVVRTDEEETGEWIDHMPDVFVIWNRTSPIDRVTSDAVGIVEYVHRGNRTGDHNPESCFFAVGPGVVPGEVQGSSIYDLMPTVAAILGVDVAETDGRVIAQLTSLDAPTRA